MGANIYPQDVEYGLYEENLMADLISRFSLSLVETADRESRPIVNIELRHVVGDADREELAATCHAGVLRHLAKVSRDFAQSLAEDPTAADVRVRIFDPATGPFAATTHKLKNSYLVKETGDRS
jgi:phenylacetate-CoA ligase